MYKDCITINGYTEKLEDDHLIINIDATTIGTLKALGVSYHIKERQITVPKQSRLGWLIGGEYGNRTTLDNSQFKGNAGLQLKNGNIITISADTDKNFWIGGMLRF